MSQETDLAKEYLRRFRQIRRAALMQQALDRLGDTLPIRCRHGQELVPVLPERRELIDALVDLITDGPRRHEDNVCPHKRAGHLCCSPLLLQAMIPLPALLVHLFNTGRKPRG